MRDNDKDKNLKIVTWNCRSYESQKNVILKYIIENDIDVLCLQETKASKEFQITRYNGFHSLYKETPKLGLAIFVKKEYIVVPVKIPTLKTETDSISVAVTLKNRVVTITNIYHKCRASAHKTLSIKTYLKVAPSDHIITGDFNIHHPVWGIYNRQTTAGDRLLEAIESSGSLVILNTGEVTYPSRDGASGTSIDLTLATADIARDSLWEVCSDLFSDHYAQLITVEADKLSLPERDPSFNLKKAENVMINENLNLSPKPGPALVQDKWTCISMCRVIGYGGALRDDIEF